MDAIQALHDLPTAALLTALFFGTFVSEDAACLAAGAAAANGQIGLVAAIGICFLGIFAGDMLLYGAGRTFGERIFENRFVRRFIDRDARSKAAGWLNRNGASAVFVSRFATGLRLPTYLAAGALRTDLKKFTAYFLMASVIWTPLLVGSAALSQKTVWNGSPLWGFAILFLLVRFVSKYGSWKNRRLMVGRIKRIVKWEFWPVQIFYIPVVIYVMWLAIRHRSLTVFTAANPAFLAGGFKGESKNDIYRTIAESQADRRHLLKYKLISGSLETSVRLLKAWQFLDENGLSFPLVIKPDVGERGANVQILYSADDLTQAIIDMRDDMILQEFVDGIEASIFYYRRPDENSGRIFSVTEKTFPSVVGDGKSTLEQLILQDARAVCLAEKYLKHIGERTEEIPATGAAVRLIDIGTHSRGAIFSEGDWLLTTELEEAVDMLCRQIDGFYFGRFDVRASSFEELRRGHFKIIELNGVTSESTNIYDQRYSLFDAYRILLAQWKLAFEIGATNMRLGSRTTGVMDLARLAVGQKPCVSQQIEHCTAINPM